MVGMLSFKNVLELQNKFIIYNTSFKELLYNLTFNSWFFTMLQNSYNLGSSKSFSPFAVDYHSVKYFKKPLFHLSSNMIERNFANI